MLTLSEIAGAAATAECAIAGKTFRVRALSAFQLARIFEAFPEPTPPKVFGDGPARINTESPKYPEYLAAANRRESCVTGAYLAAAIGLGGDVDIGGVPNFNTADSKAIREWCEDANKSLREAFTFDQLTVISHAYNRASSGVFAKAAEGLWKPIPEGHVDPPGFDELPEKRIETETMMKFRACERFGMNPSEADTLSPGMIGLMVQYDRARRKEDTELAAATLGGKL